MMVTGSVSILALLVLGLLIAGVVLLFVKLRAKAWWVVGPLLGFILLAAAGYSFVGVNVARDKMMDRASEMRTRAMERFGRTVDVRESVSEAPADASSGSGDDVSDAFLADVYPSAVDAARGAARSAYKSAGDGPLPQLKMLGNADSEIVKAVEDELRRAGDRGGKEVNCAVTVSGTDSGTVQIALEMPGKPISVSTRFVTKPWAANFAQYVADVNKPVVRAGSSPAGSFEEAQADAFADAVRQLEPYVRSALASAAATPTTGAVVTRQTLNPDSSATSQLARDVILSELRNGSLILDRFGQQFDRPYGRLWRQQLLVDASPGAMRTVAMEISNRQNNAARRTAAARDFRQQTWWNMFVRLGGLAVLIFAVYLVLNAATKGYYTTVLRVLAVSAIVAAVAVLVMIS